MIHQWLLSYNTSDMMSFCFIFFTLFFFTPSAAVRAERQIFNWDGQRPSLAVLNDRSKDLLIAWRMLSEWNVQKVSANDQFNGRLRSLEGAEGVRLFEHGSKQFVIWAVAKGTGLRVAEFFWH